jgi:hypothetical protein
MVVEGDPVIRCKVGDPSLTARPAYGPWGTANTPPTNGVARVTLTTSGSRSMSSASTWTVAISAWLLITVDDVLETTVPDDWWDRVEDIEAQPRPRHQTHHAPL